MAKASEPHQPLAELIRVFGRIGLLSFGGPAAQIALMHKELVETRGWLSEEAYLKALSFCMLLPGPEAMQLATYAGWKIRGVWGGLIGGGLFVLPGAIVIATLALLYLQFGQLPLVQAMFTGIKAVVVVIVIAALAKIAKRALSTRVNMWIAIGAFLSLFALHIPFPLVILVAAMLGAWAERTEKTGTAIETPKFGGSLFVICFGGLLWSLPLIAAYLAGHALLLEIGLFFSKLAVVTFGGAYAVLAYMTQEIVGNFGWLNTAQMIDALGLAETTPGPLILVTQFVGMLAGAAEGGWSLALLAGGMTLWVTFVPCFIWIFAGAPLIDWIDTIPWLRSALRAVTAAVVGVIASLSLWFALHVFFGTQSTFAMGPIAVPWPVLTSINVTAVGIFAIAGLLILWRNWSFPVVLGISAALGGILSLV